MQPLSTKDRGAEEPLMECKRRIRSRDLRIAIQSCETLDELKSLLIKRMCLAEQYESGSVPIPPYSTGKLM